MTPGPEAAAGYITKPWRGLVQNHLIRKGCSSKKACEEKGGWGKKEREQLGWGVERGDSIMAPGRGCPESPEGIECLLEETVLSTSLVVKVSRP